MWDGSPLDNEKLYTLTTKHFIAGGKDGYTCFTKPEVKLITDVENAKTLQSIVYSAVDEWAPPPEQPLKRSKTNAL